MGLDSSTRYLEHVMGAQLFSHGRSHFVALCPFHAENTPSFHVYANGHMHCYGCNVHFRDVIDLIMAHEGIRFTQARVRANALQLHDLSPALPEPPIARSATQDQRLFLGVIAQWSSHALTAKSGRVALDYLTQTRGIQGPYLGAILASLGYIPGPLPDDVVTLLKQLFGDRWIELAKETGVFTQSGRSRLAGRIMFWVNDRDGQIVNYQGRNMTDERPKYLGPPNWSKVPYIPSKYPYHPGTYICEGPLDAIAIAVQGYFAVALMGSAIPPLTMMKQWPQPLYGLLDHDDTQFKTGQKAQAQLAKLAQDGKLGYRDVTLNYKDPAEALQKLGPAQFKQSLMLQAA